MINKDNAFFIYVFTLVNIMAKQDKSFDPIEFELVTNILKKYKKYLTDENDFSKLLNYIKIQGFSPLSLIETTCSFVDMEQKLKGVELALKVALVDGVFDLRESKFINEIATYSQVSWSDVEVLVKKAKDFEQKYNHLENENEKEKMIATLLKSV